MAKIVVSAGLMLLSLVIIFLIPNIAEAIKNHWEKRSAKPAPRLPYQSRGRWRWGRWVLGIVILLCLINYLAPTNPQNATNPQAEAAKVEREAMALRPVPVQNGSVTITVPTKPEWSKTVTIPIRSWFQIHANEVVLVKNKKGETKPAGPEYKNDWWGDFIADRTFQFQTIGPEPTNITITWEPK